MSRFAFPLAFLLAAAGAHSADVAGKDYVVLDPPQPQSVRGKIEVIEFFSWGCPHCADFNPVLARWKAALPRDVDFKRVPIGAGHAQWEILAKTFYALQSTGDLARLDTPLFDAIHKEHVVLDDEASLTAWVGQHGVNTAKFTAAYDSFNTAAALGKADAAAVAYKVDFIPTLAIAGHYSVTGDHDKMLAQADALIAKARAEMAPRVK